MNKDQAKKYSKKVESTLIPFFDFDETKEGEFKLMEKKSIKIDGEEKEFRQAVDISSGEIVLLPSNVNLDFQLKTLADGTECYIICKGLQKVEGSKNKVKIFEVFTA